MQRNPWSDPDLIHDLIHDGTLDHWTSPDAHAFTLMTQARFASIYRQDGAGLARVARLYGGRDADDLGQEIALAIWLGLKRFRGDSSLRTFAYRIAHNQGLTFRTRNNTESDNTLDSAEVELLATGSTEAEVMAAQQRERLFQAMRRLNQQTQTVVALSLEGFTYAEISAVVGISENHVGVILNRGKKTLKHLLKE